MAILLKISVIVPTRDNGNRLAATLQSLSRQTLPVNHYEILVVDNGSTDDTEQVLSRLSMEIANLKWVKELQTGRAHARNRGIVESTGGVTLFLDDDIAVEPNHLELHLNCHAQFNIPVAVIGRVVDVSPITPAWAQDYFHARQVAGSPVASSNESGIPLGLYFATGNVSLLRNTLEDIKIQREGCSYYFDPVFRVREDGDMGCRLIKQGVHFIFADEILCRHYHPRSWRSIVGRSYESGYALVQLFQRHPETRATGLKNVMSSPLINYVVGAAAVVLFAPTFSIKAFWPQPFRKVVGALLAYQASRGYRHALRDLNNSSNETSH